MSVAWQMHMVIICCECTALCSPHRWHLIRWSCWGGYCGRWRPNTISLYSALSSRGPNSGCQSQTPPTKSSVLHMSPGAIQELGLLLAFLISTVQWGITFHLSCIFFPPLECHEQRCLKPIRFLLLMTVQTHHMCSRKTTGGGNGNKWNYVDEFWLTHSYQSSFGHQIRVFLVLQSEISMMMMCRRPGPRTLPNISSSLMDIRGSDILHLPKKPEHCTWALS